MDRLIEGSRRLFAGEEDVNFSDLCIDSYVSMAVECIAQIRSVPELLSMPGNLPALVHCTAGKWTEHTSSDEMAACMGIGTQCLEDLRRALLE